MTPPGKFVSSIGSSLLQNGECSGIGDSRSMAIKYDTHGGIHFPEIVGNVLAVPLVLSNDHWVACDRVSLHNAKIHVVIFAKP